ncbi:MAG: hypothetical protein H6841_07790 [Planctomycetes bacterium]|nr:hypothetical protein [Planctomycetota bacterium]MCB9935504.1 hypothetical protein [Planctomycetota bacterium]
MNQKTQAYLILGLLVLLMVTVALDPRVPSYRSTYDPPATAREIAQWAEDIKAWPRSPSWQRFSAQPQADPLGAPDFSAAYVFGKYDYRVDVQIRGDRIQYISWGNDDQDNGGAWYAVGEGRQQRNGEWFSVWSCLDLSRAVSNGGGAWFKFSRDRKRIHVRYYHDTLPFGEAPIEIGEAVQVNLKPHEEMPRDRKSVIADSVWADRPLEGRIRTRTETLHATEGQNLVIWGRVVDDRGEGVDGAAVKRRAAGRIETVSDSRGFFKLELDKLEALTLITAGKLGYTNGIVTLEQQTAFSAIGPDFNRERVALATIELRPMERVDYPTYEWVSPQYLPPSRYDAAQHLNCGNCHRREFNDWKVSRHATMARNAWVRAAFERDARPFALSRGLETDGCTPCHSPSLAAKLEQFQLRGKTLLDAQGVDLEGNHCDFCHKIEAITVPEAPGMNGSIRLLRPNPHDDTVPGGVKRVFGPLPDVSFLYMGAGYNPLFQMGMLCAGCHEHHTDDGLVGQGTYSEWRRTKYAMPGSDYRECQSCHMPQYQAGKVRMLPGRDGIPVPTTSSGDLSGEEAKNNGVAIARFSTRYRPLNEAHKHSFVGSEDREFLKGAIDMQVSLEPLTDGVRVRVTLTNTGAGHAVPTGHGLKRYVLAVTGFADGKKLAPGNEFPAEERVGAADDATTGALIGRRFAGEAGPDWSLPWWRADSQESDNRLWPDQPREFVFELAGADAAEVKLILRRGSPALVQSHGLEPAGGTLPDVPVHERKVGP